MRMKFLPVLLYLGIASAQAASLVVDKTISGFASPESVAVVGGDVFVANVGARLEPMAKDGDGFISRLDRQGNIRNLTWIGGLDAPKGLIEVAGVLYVADIDRVLGWRIRDGKQVFALDLAATGSRFLNAFARYDNQRLLLSATDIGKVFVIDLPGRKFSELSFDVPPKGPNGMKKQGSHLVVAEWGTEGQANGGVKFYRLEGMHARLEKAFQPQPAGYFDGVVGLGGNRWLVSNWVKFEPAGQLLILDTRSGWTSVLDARSPLAGPADIFLDDQDKLWVPGMLANKVYRMTLRR